MILKQNSPRLLILILFLVFSGMAVLKAQEVETLAVIPELTESSGGISVDQEGNVYIAHFSGTTVFKIYPNGTFETFATGFKSPTGNAFDSQGNFYQANYRDPLNPPALDHIDKIDTAGVKTTFATGLNGPAAITIDSMDNLFVCGCDGNVVYKVTQDGTVQTFASSPLFNCPNGITFDDTGNLYMVNWFNGGLFKITPDGTVSLFATIPGGGNAHISFYDGFFYVTAHSLNQIYKIDSSGNVELLAGTGVEGSLDGPLLEATFTRPNACTVSPDGQFVYTGGRDSRVRKVRINTSITAVHSPKMERALNSLTLSPNPSAGIIRVALMAKNSGDATFVICDINGLPFQTKSVQLKAGENDIVWNIRENQGQLIPSGVYFLKVVAGDDFPTEKLIIGGGL